MNDEDGILNISLFLKGPKGEAGKDGIPGRDGVHVSMSTLW